MLPWSLPPPPPSSPLTLLILLLHHLYSGLGWGLTGRGNHGGWWGAILTVLRTKGGCFTSHLLRCGEGEGGRRKRRRWEEERGGGRRGEGRRKGEGGEKERKRSWEGKE